MQVGPSARLQAAEGSQLAQAFAEMEGQEASGEDSELVCMVCKEGYASTPRELLGAYCFCTVSPASDQATIAPPASVFSSLPSSASHQVSLHCSTLGSHPQPGSNLSSGLCDIITVFLCQPPIKCVNPCIVRRKPACQFWSSLRRVPLDHVCKASELVRCSAGLSLS